MTIRITLFAMLKEEAGVANFEIDISEGSTGAELLTEVGKLYPVLSDYLSYVRLASPEKYLRTREIIDVIATPELYIIPPVSGG